MTSGGGWSTTYKSDMPCKFKNDIFGHKLFICGVKIQIYILDSKLEYFPKSLYRALCLFREINVNIII